MLLYLCRRNLRAVPFCTFVDVHAHLFHEKFINKHEEVHKRCLAAGVENVINNGLCPITNRLVLSMSRKYPQYLPAAGIYPIDACCHLITEWKWPFHQPKRFDIEAEIEFIDGLASRHEIVAIGECGMDKHFLSGDLCMQQQERVMRALMRVACRNDLPLIMHSRKAERRVFEVAQEEGVRRAIFHCFTGKIGLGKEIAAAGFMLSIPPVIVRSPNFQRLVAALPVEAILTETDSPYMSAEGSDIVNEPSYIPLAVHEIARVKEISTAAAKQHIKKNFDLILSDAVRRYRDRRLTNASKSGS